MVSREDQVNANLAAAVPLDRQSLALALRNHLEENIRGFVSEDEFILHTNRAIEDNLSHKTLLQILLAVGLAGSFGIGLFIENNIVGGVIATICAAVYFARWNDRFKSTGDRILIDMVGLAMRRKEAAQGKSQSSNTQDPFDVPPQNAE